MSRGRDTAGWQLARWIAARIAGARELMAAAELLGSAYPLPYPLR